MTRFGSPGLVAVQNAGEPSANRSLMLSHRMATFWMSDAPTASYWNVSLRGGMKGA
jgi:hypothetical protein